MRRRSRRSGQMTIAYIAIFVLAFVLSLVAVQVLPIPDRYTSLTFFVLVPVLSFLGVVAVSIIKKNKR